MSSTSPLPPPASASSSTSPIQSDPSILPTQTQEQDPASRTHSSDDNAAEMAEVTSRFAFHQHTNQPHEQHRYASSDYEPYPASARSTPRSPRSRRSSSAPSTLQWLTRLFIRSPKSLSEKRDYLLPKSKSSSRCSSLSRRSTDLESQASTLLGLDEKLSKSGSSGKTRIDPRVISDAIIGLSDGLTVPFALTAGLSTMGSTKVVIFAGLAELTAGAISMGLGGYLAAKSEEESYHATLTDTKTLVSKSPEESEEAIRQVFEPYKLPPHLTEDLALHLSKSPNLVQFLMHFQQNAPEQAASRAFTCALTIACGYFLGGFLPLVPYFLVGKDQVLLALYWSFAFMALSLFSFGYGKTCFVSGWTGRKNIWEGTKGGLQMMLVGGTAAICAMSLVRLFDSFAT